MVLPGPWVPAGPVLWVLLPCCYHSWGCVHWLRGALQSPSVTLPPGGSGWQWGWGHQECDYPGQGLVAGGSAAWLWAPGRGRQGTFPPSALRLAPFPASGFSAGTEGGLLVQVLQCSRCPKPQEILGEARRAWSLTHLCPPPRDLNNTGQGMGCWPIRIPGGWPADSRSMVLPGRQQGQTEGLRKAGWSLLLT